MSDPVSEAFLNHAVINGNKLLPNHAPNMRDSIDIPETPEDMHEEVRYDSQGIFTCIATHAGWTEWLQMPPDELLHDLP